MSKASLQERREYLKSNVNPILEILVADLMKERPEKVVTPNPFSLISKIK